MLTIMTSCRIIFIFGLLMAASLFSSQMKAEDAPRTHNILVEFLESTEPISVKYDTRFRRNPKFGWSIGVGYSTISYNYNYDCTGVALPLGINGLFGKRASKFEIGLNVGPGYYNYRERSKEYYRDNLWEFNYVYGPRKSRVRCPFGFDIGYRLQRQNGFCFRIGFSPFRGAYYKGLACALMTFYPYFGFGYTFTK